MTDIPVDSRIAAEKYSLDWLIQFAEQSDCRAVGLGPTFDRIRDALVELKALRLAATASEQRAAEMLECIKDALAAGRPALSTPEEWKVVRTRLTAAVLAGEPT